jgi:hypothetical protein
VSFTQLVPLYFNTCPFDGDVRTTSVRSSNTETPLPETVAQEVDVPLVVKYLPEFVACDGSTFVSDNEVIHEGLE